MKRKRSAQLYLGEGILHLSTISLHGKDGGASGLPARIGFEAIGSMGLGVKRRRSPDNSSEQDLIGLTTPDCVFCS